MKSIVFTSHKGGVGKTVFASHLAQVLAREGKKTLLVDTSPFASGAAVWNIYPGEKSQKFSPRLAPWGGEIYSLAPNLDFFSAGKGFLPPQERFQTLHAMLKDRRLLDWDCVLVDSEQFGGELSKSLIDSCDSTLLFLKTEPLEYRALASFLAHLKELRYQGLQFHLEGVVLSLPAGEKKGGKWEKGLKELFGPVILSPSLSYTLDIDRALSKHQTLLDFNPESNYLREVEELAETLCSSRNLTPLK